MKKLLSLLFITSAISFSTSAQEKILFKINPEKGKTIKYDMNVQTDVEGEQSLIMDMNFKMNMTSTEILENSLTFEVKYDQMKMDMDMGLMKMSYDSSVEPTDAAAQMIGEQLKPILENIMTINMNKSGETLDIQFPNVQGQLFDKSAVEGLATKYPTTAIAIGDSWEQEKDFPQIGAKGKIKTTFAEKTADGYKFTTATDVIDSSGKSIGTATGYSIVDSKTLMNKYSIGETTMEVQGNKVTAKVEIKQTN